MTLITAGNGRDQPAKGIDLVKTITHPALRKKQEQLRQAYIDLCEQARREVSLAARSQKQDEALNALQELIKLNRKGRPTLTVIDGGRK